jgi:hypothetical protein
MELYNNPRGRITLWDVDEDDTEAIQDNIKLAEKAQEFLLMSLDDFDSVLPVWLSYKYSPETGVRFFNNKLDLNRVAGITMYEGIRFWSVEYSSLRVRVNVSAAFDSSPGAVDKRTLWSFEFTLEKVDGTDEWSVIEAGVNTDGQQLYALYPEDESLNPANQIIMR